jgi:dTDP-4-amino-4,6-dideoxygalactose transaminase
MLVSETKSLVDRARFLASQAKDPAPHYEHSSIGYNYRLSNVLAAIGRGQLQTLAERVAIRRQIFERYNQRLGDLPGLEFMPEAFGCISNRWLTCLTIDPSKFGTDRESVRRALETENIEARPVWKPMHLQPVFAGSRIFGGKISERLFQTGLCLPSGSNLQEADQDRVISAIRRICRA